MWVLLSLNCSFPLRVSNHIQWLCVMLEIFIINLRMIQQLMPRNWNEKTSPVGFLQSRFVSLQNKELAQQRAEETRRRAHSRFGWSDSDEQCPPCSKSSKLTLSLSWKPGREFKDCPVCRHKEKIQWMLFFGQAHSHLIIYVPISCSTKTLVSSVFIIQGKGGTQDARTEWGMHLLLITMPGGGK